MNFAPYQSSPPESERAKSPPPPSASPIAAAQQQQRVPPSQRNMPPLANGEDPWAAARAQRLPSPSRYHDDEDAADASGGYTDLEGQRTRNDYIGSDALGSGGAIYTGNGNIFETSLNIPLPIEATLAYLLLPPAGGVILLLLEHKSDYVRFHAWQSALLFSGLFLVHIIFSWTAIVSYILLAVDVVLIMYLAHGALRNAETLDRVEIPFVGRLASSFVDDE